jgi:hypothetical protein
MVAIPEAKEKKLASCRSLRWENHLAITLATLATDAYQMLDYTFQLCSFRPCHPFDHSLYGCCPTGETKKTRQL